jgi:hypothetical protein
METIELIAAIDSEISRLQSVRNLLAGAESRNGAKPINRRGGKRRLSAEGRARISAAMKKRWAAQKKAAKR